MNEHLLLISNEIERLKINLENAKVRPGVSKREIANIERRIRLKQEIFNFIYARCQNELRED